MCVTHCCACSLANICSAGREIAGSDLDGGWSSREASTFIVLQLYLPPPTDSSERNITLLSFCSYIVSGEMYDTAFPPSSKDGWIINGMR